MRSKWQRLAALLLLWTGLATRTDGETFLVIVEEFRNGEAVQQPLASQEGLMSAMFDLGHVTFETGPYRPEMNWDKLEFAEPLMLTREGRGRYLAVARVFAESSGASAPAVVSAPASPGQHPRQGSTSSQAPLKLSGPEATALEGVETTARAAYLLFDAETSRLVGRGELSASSSEGERELTYGELLFATGEKLARAIVSLLSNDPLR